MTSNATAAVPNGIPDGLEQYRLYTQVPWEDALIIIAHEIARYTENVRYVGSQANPSLVAELVKVGRDVKAKQDPARQGKEYQVEWPGRFTLMAYPTRGKFQFIPNKNIPEVDATLAFLTFLCGTESMPARFQREWNLITPPLTRLNYSRVQAAQVLQSLALAFVEIEQAILSDPFKSLPVNEWVSQTHPALKHLPEETTVFSINASCSKKTGKPGKRKEVCYAGSAGSTTVMHAINHRSAEFQDWARQEIDLVRDIADVVDRSRLEERDSAAQVALQVEDNTKTVKQAMRMVRTTNKDHAQLSERLRQQQVTHEEQVTVQREQLEVQRDIAERVTAAEAGIRDEVRFNTQETAENLRTLGGVIELLGGKVDQLDLKQSIRFQGMMDQERANFREIQATRQDIQQAKQEVLATIGDFFNRLAAYLAERDVTVDQHLGSIDACLLQLQHLYTDHVAQLKTLHQEANPGVKKKVQDKMIPKYAAILTVVDVTPDLTVAQVGKLVGRPTGDTWYCLQRLGDMNLVGREQQDTEVACPRKTGETTEEDSSPSISKQSKQVPTIKRVVRRLWHYFRQRDPRPVGDTQNDDNQKMKSKTKVKKHG